MLIALYMKKNPPHVPPFYHLTFLHLAYPVKIGEAVTFYKCSSQTKNYLSLADYFHAGCSECNLNNSWIL